MLNSDNRNRTIVRNTIVLYVRMLIQLMVGLYTTRIVLHSLGPVDYGIYNVIGGIVIIFSILNTSISVGTQRFLTIELGSGNISKLNKVYINSVNIHLFLSILFFILAETIGLWYLNNKLNIPTGREFAALWTYQCVVLSTISIITTVPDYAVIVAREKFLYFTFVTLADVCLNLVVAFLISLVHCDKLIFYSTAYLVIVILTRLAYKLYTRLKFDEARYKLSIDKSLTIEMLHFSGWNLSSNLSTVLMTQGVNILLNFFFNPIINAARGLAVQIQNVVNRFASNFQIAFNPQIIKSYASNDLHFMKNLITRACRFSYILLFSISLPIIFEAETLLNIWLKEVPEYTPIFIKLILCTSIVDSMSNPISTAVNATGKIKTFHLGLTFLQISSLPIGYIILKIGMPPYSVFVLCLLITLFAAVARIVILCRVLNLKLSDFAYNVLFRCLLVSVLPILGTVLLEQHFHETLAGSIVIILISFSLAVLSSFIFGLTNNEKKFCVDFIKQKIKIMRVNS